MASVIDTLLMPGVFQTVVHRIGPCRPPEDKLFLTVPVGGDGILPSIFGAFRIFGYPSQPLRFSRRGCHINLFLPVPILILLLPALTLCCFELRRCKAPFFAVLDAQIFLLRFMLPFAISGQRPHGQHDMSVGIVAVRIVDTDIGAHSLHHKIGMDKISQQGNPLVPVQFNGERHNELTCKATVLCFLRFFHSVPEDFPVCPFCRCHIWQRNLLPDKPLFSSVVMLDAVVIIIHPGTTHIGCCCDSGTACSPTDNLCL